MRRLLFFAMALIPAGNAAGKGLFGFHCHRAAFPITPINKAGRGRPFGWHLRVAVFFLALGYLFRFRKAHGSLIHRFPRKIFTPPAQLLFYRELGVAGSFRFVARAFAHGHIVMG